MRVTVRWRETCTYEQTFDFDDDVDITDFNAVENELIDYTDETTWTDHLVSLDDRVLLDVREA